MVSDKVHKFVQFSDGKPTHFQGLCNHNNNIVNYNILQKDI